MKKISYFILLLVISISIILKLLPYILYHYSFLIGFDSGRYIYELGHKTSSNLQLLNLWIEPGLNTNLVALNAILNQPPSYIYMYILPICTSIIFPLIVFLYTQRITNSTISGVYAACIIATSSIFLTSTFDSFYRQIFGTIIFMNFLYFLDLVFSKSSVEKKKIVLLSLLGAGIIISHRGVSLLYVFAIGLFSIKYIIEKKYHVIISLIIIFGLSLLISSIYWLYILKENIIVLKEAIQNSVSKTSGGERIIKKLSRNDNQIQGYITSIYSSFLPILGIIYLIIKNKLSFFTLFVVFLTIYIYAKATFSNRFLFNLDILFAICAGVAFYYMKSSLNKTVFLLISLMVLTINLANSLKIAEDRKPYITEKSDSINWIEKNINTKESIIFAPDALSTILAQMQYKTTLNEYPIVLGSGQKDSATITELFLINGYKDLTYLDPLDKKKDKIYVMFDDWNLINPLPRAHEKINITNWDNSKHFKILYRGDFIVRRIYEYRN